MGLLTKIAFRNLLRQKRRNLLLGIAIAFGMAILVVANSFSHGITDLLLNRFIVNMAGHVSVTVIENGHFRSSITHDKERFTRIIKENVRGIKELREGISTFGRGVGNGKADQFALVGMPLKKDTLEYFNGDRISGNVYDFTNRNYENPVIMYEDKAKDLNVKPGDTVNLRTRTVRNQAQTARLTLVAVLRSASSFQGMAVYTPLDSLRNILGYKPQETGVLQVIIDKLKNPTQAMVAANQLYAALKPETALFYGKVSGTAANADATVLGYLTNDNLLANLTNQIRIVSGRFALSTNTNTALISEKLAGKLGVQPGDTVSFTYREKFGNAPVVHNYRIAAVYKPAGKIGDNTLLVNENFFYPNYLGNLPPDSVSVTNAWHPKTNDVVAASLAPEWRLLPRTATSIDYQKKMMDARKTKWRGMYVDVSTMYEIAEMVIQLESALNLITMIAVLILFFIILIGVVNTMRMTIRERTREIGTIRAIGMQSNAVRNTFILETFFLTLFATAAGVVIGLIITGLLSLIRIDTTSILSILLLDKHLHLVPNAGSIISNLILILIIAVVTAYFPSKKAAKMKAADALRHYE